MSGVLPSLSHEGWITSSKSILAYNIAHYILSDAGQSIAFQGNIINLPETYYKNINDPDAMAVAVKSDLESLLGRYFVSVEVQTAAKEITNKKFAILIFATVIDKDNVKHDISRITEINSASLRKIIEINNFGEGLNYLRSI